MTTLFVSDAIVEERLNFYMTGPNAALSGWRKLSALYQQSFASCGLRVRSVIRPEIYHTEISHQLLGVEPGDWHLAVKPLEHLRPFHHLSNAFVCNWPFATLGSTLRGESPFFHQARLLGAADAIFCCTDFTTKTLHSAGVTHAFTLPPAIPTPKVAPYRASRRGPTQFLSVLEPSHLDRQLTSLIEGFGAAIAEKDLRLTLYLQGAGPNSLSLLEQHVARNWPASIRPYEEFVAIIGGGAGEELDLYHEADFFLCAHSAPGLFLPLAEAALAGLPLVTTLTGGTASFLAPEAIIPITTTNHVLSAEEEMIARFVPLTAHPPAEGAVRAAVLTADALAEIDRRRIAKAGQELAQACFGDAAFRLSLQSLDAIFEFAI
ncbi:glycosyltransferase family protein [Acidisoma sp. 7E03]